MKKLTQTAIVLASMAVSGLSFAASIVGSGHDLGGNNANDNQQICVYCHTPHNASTAAPLWNRSLPTGPYTMYSSPTLDMTIAASPQGTSLACLSCHDGSIAVDQLLNFPPGMSSNNVQIDAGVNFGTDLSNDHPVSITYDHTLDTDFVAAVGGQVGGLQLFGAGADQVECASCHLVHDPAISPFLRVSNAGSAMCLSCHVK